MGSNLGTDSNKPERVIKGPMGRCKSTTPSSFLLALTGFILTTNLQYKIDSPADKWIVYT